MRALRRRADPTGLTELLERPPGHTLQVAATDGVLLHVEVDEPAAGHRGEAPTVVLSHGFTLDRRCWVYQRATLSSAGYRVVVWDQRGHGRSARGSRAGYTIDQLGLDLDRVVSAAAPTGRIVLAGHSMGAMTVMAYAGSWPAQVADRVLGVALVSASAGGLDRVRWGLGERVGAQVNRVGPVVAEQLASWQGLLRTLRGRGPRVDEIPVLASSFGSRVPREVVALTAEMIFQTDLGVLSAFAPTLQGHDKREAVAALGDLSTLIVVGDRDVLTTPVHSSELAVLLPRARHVVVARAGHIIMLEHPEVISRLLLELVERPTPGSSVRQMVTDLHPGRGRRGLTLGGTWWPG